MTNARDTITGPQRCFIRTETFSEECTLTQQSEEILGSPEKNTRRKKHPNPPTELTGKVVALCRASYSRLRPGHFWDSVVRSATGSSNLRVRQLAILYMR
jgi:hypothetical protein